MYILSSAIRRSDALVSIKALRDMFEDHLVKIAALKRPAGLIFNPSYVNFLRKRKSK